MFTFDPETDRVRTVDRRRDEPTDKRRESRCLADREQTAERVERVARYAAVTAAGGTLFEGR